MVALSCVCIAIKKIADAKVKKRKMTTTLAMK